MGNDVLGSWLKINIGLGLKISHAEGKKYGLPAVTTPGTQNSGQDVDTTTTKLAKLLIFVTYKVRKSSLLTLK